MKITDHVIIFILIFLCLIVRIDIRYNTFEAMEMKKVEYNNNLDNAVDDAVLDLLDYNSSQDSSYNINRELSVNKFFKSLYASFGVLHDSDLREKLCSCVPVIAITDYDGFYIYFRTLYKDSDGNTCSKYNWTEKFPYSYDDGSFLYSFTFSDSLKVFDKNTYQVKEGVSKDLVSLYPGNGVLMNFEYYRRMSITESIQKKLEHYINQYNLIAEQFGFKYSFFLPENTNDELERAIDNIGMFVIFQNYPYGVGTDVYNRYLYGAARVKEKDSFFLTNENGARLYHKSSCIKSSGVSDYRDSKKECAKEGYFPCELCNP